MSILIKGMDMPKRAYNRTLIMQNKSTIVRSPTILEEESER